MEAASYTFGDDCMFNRVMSDPSICRRVLERILSVKISSVTYQNTQQEASSGVFSKGVRMDVYLEGDGRVYDVEMQSRSEPCVAKRFRYYQSIIDSGVLAKGQDYDLLPESYIIFLFKHDPFGEGLPVYTIERLCRENAACKIECASHWMALNASAWSKAEDKGIRNLLSYVKDGDIFEGDTLIGDIDKAVHEANHDERWMDDLFSVSTIEEDIRRWARITVREAVREAERKSLANLAKGEAEGLAKGKAQGLAEGKAQEAERYNKLVKKLAAENRLDELARAADNPEALSALFEEL